jgi:hypothetical protein
MYYQYCILSRTRVSNKLWAPLTYLLLQSTWIIKIYLSASPHSIANQDESALNGNHLTLDAVKAMAASNFRISFSQRSETIFQ